MKRLLPTFPLQLVFTSYAFCVSVGSSNSSLLPSYDYVVVGCGISGLVVANRLSENPNVSVLCIEAGNLDNYEEVIQVPVFVGGDIGGRWDWNLQTVPQTFLDGVTRPMPQGRVVGGGSILNAMCWNRGGAEDYDAWEALGNPGWGWSGLLPYFIKSENYTPVYSEAIAEQYSIHYSPSAHGTSGPVHVSYPKYFYNQSVNLFTALNELGVPTAFDPNDGTSAGAMFVPTDLDPDNQTCSDARRSYYDPYTTRSNFHLMTGQHVTRLIIDNVRANTAVSQPMAGGNENGEGSASGAISGGLFGNGSTIPPPSSGGSRTRFATRDNSGGLHITGVEYAPDASTPRQSILAKREVIVAAGALHSVQLLQLSGIGPRALLDSLNIPVALDLPGVGNNLQDHALVGTFYPYNNASYRYPTDLTTNAVLNADARQEYYSRKTGPWTAGSPNALAFLSLPSISNISSSILAEANNQTPQQYLADLDPTLVAGYEAQKESLVRRLASSEVAAYEIINNNAGSLTIAVMHPFSRGVCHITSTDPFEPPLIDPRYGSNPVDLQVFIEALRFNRRILDTPSMRILQPAEFVPTREANDSDLLATIKNGVRTEYHPSCTLAMLPLEQGGVVDPHLRVWGTQNLRIVDASIFPMIPAAHLQASVYGVAEKAADIIKADNIQPNYANLTSSSNSTSDFTSPLTSFNSTSNVSMGFAPAQSNAISSVPISSEVSVLYSNDTSKPFATPSIKASSRTPLGAYAASISFPTVTYTTSIEIPTTADTISSASKISTLLAQAIFEDSPTAEVSAAIATSQTTSNALLSLVTGTPKSELLIPTVSYQADPQTPITTATSVFLASNGGGIASEQETASRLLISTAGDLSQTISSSMQSISPVISSSEATTSTSDSSQPDVRTATTLSTTASPHSQAASTTTDMSEPIKSLISILQTAQETPNDQQNTSLVAVIQWLLNFFHLRN